MTYIIAVKRYNFMLHLATDAGDWPRRVDNNDAKHFSSARIDLRKLAQLFTGQQLSPAKVICSKLQFGLAACVARRQQKIISCVDRLVYFAKIINCV